MSNDLIKISWISDAISEQHIQLFDDKDFDDVTECAEGGFSQVKCAYWKCSERKVALKKLKEFKIQKFVQEVKMHISCHWSKNVVRFFGLMKERSVISEYTMVMEYADHQSLRNCLKSRLINNDDWETKYNISLDIAKGLQCLHSRKIAHRDLNNLLQHTDNIVIKRGCCQPKLVAQITDFGGATSMNNDVVDFNGDACQVPFTEPEYLDRRKCERDEISDIYSLGVIFWEISSHNPPFKNYLLELGKLRLILHVLAGNREKVPSSTPKIYSLLYQGCWDRKRDKRPTLEQIIGNLDNIFIYQDFWDQEKDTLDKINDISIFEIVDRFKQNNNNLKDNNVQNINESNNGVQDTNESNNGIQDNESNNGVQDTNEFNRNTNDSKSCENTYDSGNFDIDHYNLNDLKVNISIQQV